MAVDGIADICLGCPISSTHESSLGWGGFVARTTGASIADSPAWASLGAGNNVASNGARRQLLRYISPEFAGFVFSADTGLDENSSDDARWTIALRYANEFNGVRIAGGIGYHEEDNLEGWGGSLSMMHTASGLFVAGSYGEQTDNNIVGALFRDTTDGWSVVAGLVRKFSPLGKTTFWVRYGEYAGRTFDANNGGIVDTHGDSEVIGLGINQKIDAAAMEVYVSYWHVSGDFEVVNGVGALPQGSYSPDDLNAVMIGARIKF